MKKVFQIIEKIVYGIAALAIVLVVIMMVYGVTPKQYLYIFLCVGEKK